MECRESLGDDRSRVVGGTQSLVLIGATVVVPGEISYRAMKCPLVKARFVNIKFF